MSETRTAAAYIRVSTEDQLEYSPDSQIRKIREYAERNNIIIPDENIFTDEGISGRSAEKRPAFMKMISLAKSVPSLFSVILVWKFSRFARNREDSIIYKSMLRKQYGIDVISVSEQLGEDKTSILIEAMLEAMDEYYSINLAEEVRRGMNEKFSRGEAVSPPPFGYRSEHGLFIPDTEKADVVRMIFDDYISGQSSRAIALKLNALGITTSRGNEFQQRTVEYILSNPVYTGKLRRNTDGTETVVTGKHKAIITENVYAEAVKKLSLNKKTGAGSSHRLSSEFMLHGLVRCSACGAVLVRASKGKYLQCHRYSKGQCTSSHCVSVNELNKAVLDKISSDLAPCIFSFRILPYRNIKNRELNKSLLTREYRRLTRIKEAFESGIYSIDEYRNSRDNILSVISQLEKKADCSCKAYKDIELSAADLVQKFTENIFSEEAKNIFLRSFISEIIFDRKRSAIQIKYHFLQ